MSAIAANLKDGGNCSKERTIVGGEEFFRGDGQLS